jgi:hypothetical protein
MPAFAFIIVLHVSAYGYHAEILPNDPKFQGAFAREADCEAAAARIAREIKIPAIASLDKIVCRKMEIKK